MEEDVTNGLPYTPRFCEENVWWLLHNELVKGVASDRMRVMWISNPERQVLMLNQKAFPYGVAMCWDYHVVLLRKDDRQWRVLDLDSRLDCPVVLDQYLEKSFPPESVLPQLYRAYTRLVPARQYLSRFYSDRSHMKGQIPDAEFPQYPIIQPQHQAQRITIQQYWTIEQPLEGCVDLPLNRLQQFLDDD